MGRVTGDGRHEGAVHHFFADGTYGASTEAAGPIATTAPGGALLAEWQTHTWDDVVAFQAICVDCSNPLNGYPQCWEGSTWITVAADADHDPANRRIRRPADGLSEEIEDLILAEWEQHIRPLQGCYEVELAAEALSEAQRQLTAAVRSAREQGASWDAIGQAAGMTRQSAHERWAKLLA